MKRILVLLMCFLLPLIVFAQLSYQAVADNGGGTSTSSAVRLVSSIGQGVQGTATGTVKLFGGFISVTESEAAIQEQDIEAQVSNSSFFPNPFNRVTSIDVHLEDPSLVKLTIHDLMGNQVFQFERTMTRGSYSLKFRPDESLTRGIYFYRIQTGEQLRSGRIVYMR